MSDEDLHLYFEKQGRFRKGDYDLDLIRSHIQEHWELIRSRLT